MKELGQYDIIVAGLGPAGSVALFHAASKGFKVLGIDIRPWSELWGKPCGDAIGAHHFPNAGLGEPPTHVVKVRVKAIDIYSPSLRAKYRVYGEGFIIDRKKLGQYIVGSARDKGAEILLEAAVVKPVIENGYVRGVVVRLSDGTHAVAYAKTVIDATGNARVIARQLPEAIYFRDDIVPQDLNIAFREVVAFEDSVIEEPEVLRIYLDKRVAPGGYWWFFPEGKSEANVGLGVQGGRGYPHPASLYDKYLRSKLSSMGRYRVIESAGAAVPTRRPAATLVGNGVMVIGDAGYTVNPLHGGGMGYSFYSAYLAVNAFEEAYNHGSFSAQALWSLNVKYMRGLGAKQAALDVFRMFLQELENTDIDFAMENKLIPEADVYDVSTTGELKLSIVEKALIVLRGLRKPTLLFKLKQVADYMAKVRKLYLEYPESPQEFKRWLTTLNSVLEEYRRFLLQH